MARISRVISLARSGNVSATLDNHRRAKRGTPRRLLPHPVPGGDGTSARRINALYSGMPTASRYLEVGLYTGRTLEQVQLPTRVGVDPHPRFDLGSVPANTTIHAVTSDEFFAMTAPDTGFDIVFLDGLHTYQQTYLDLMNTLALCGRGVILIDDVVPSDEVSAMSDQALSFAQRKRAGLAGYPYPWHGDVYKVMLCIREHHPELRVRTILDAGNPQALVWRPDATAPSAAIDAAELNRFAGVAFGDVFVDGPPDYFGPSSEATALADALGDVGHRFLA